MGHTMPHATGVLPQVSLVARGYLDPPSPTPTSPAFAADIGSSAHALINKMTAEAHPYDFDPWARPGPK